MARVLPLHMAAIRYLLLGLLAIGLAFRVGGPCDAMAATLAPAFEHMACADTPVEHQKPVGASTADCALCAALPGRAAAPSAWTSFDPAEPQIGAVGHLAGLAGGPAPPPPRLA